MRNFDFSPFARSAIGFDNLFDRLNDRSEVRRTRPTTSFGRTRMRSRLTSRSRGSCPRKSRSQPRQASLP